MGLGNNLRNARLKAGLTPEQLAERVCITRPALIKYEDGQAIPNLVTGIKLADALNVNVYDLLRDGETRTEAKDDDA